MSVTINKTLLALVLALKDIEDISQDEQNAFQDAADQLQLEPNNWQDYEDDLLRVIQANSSLNQLYQTAKFQLDALSSEIPFSLLPTQAELEQAIPTNTTQTERGFVPVIEDDESHEINNMVINVLTTPHPQKTAKKLSRLEQFQQFLKQTISKQ